MRQEIKEQLKGTSLARGMTDEDVEALLASSQVRLVHYKKGEIIFHEGDVPERLFLLVSGAVRILKDTYSGRQIFLGEIRKPGVMFGEVYLFIERHAYDMFTQALASTELLEISSRMLTQGAAEDDFGEADDPERAQRVRLQGLLQRNLLRDFARKAYQMNNMLKVLASGSLRGKIARYLMLQPQKADGKICLSESRESTAIYLAVSRPALSRELSAMQKEGILAVESRTIHILDREKLEEYL
ncbi:Crp/Fnr family transcriptional regulator [uncultured Selenomonas sp.]|uniref:Crp/Fnr family transcriptional regulator n=1 Tax=uncultured Selenomonas sp. TaxID=159275 RepID=UPI0028E9957D|nr:Crp/Fnr family transcriptional regulator [uncultured Selenomonas sp.]